MVAQGHRNGCSGPPEWLLRATGMVAQGHRNGCSGPPEWLLRATGMVAQGHPGRLQRGRVDS